MLEFIKSDVEEETKQEMEFVATVADTFHISVEEYETIKDYIFLNEEKIPHSPQILLINGNQEEIRPEIKHIYSEICNLQTYNSLT